MEKIYPTNVDTSAIETELLGLKVGRCNHDFFDPQQLYRQIAEGKYDLCRLKVPAEDDFATHRLHQTGLPFFFSGSIRKYRTRLADYPTVYYKNPDLVFEMYDGTQDKLLKDMLVGTWGIYPLGYYRSPYLSELVDKEQEIECVYQYYKKYNLNRDHPGNMIYFMKHGNNYVGVFTLNIVGNTLECNLAGILEPYRSGGYFHDEMNFKKEYCIIHGLEYFTFGARNENAPVQRIFQHLNFQTAGNDNVFHIPSLLSYSQRPSIEKEINGKGLDSAELAQRLFTEAKLLIPKDISLKPHRISFQLNNEQLLATDKTIKLRFSFPVTTGKEILIVVCSDNAVEFTGYLRVWA